MKRSSQIPCPSCGAALDAFARELTCGRCDRDYILEVDDAAGSLYRGEPVIVARPSSRPSPDSGAVDVGTIPEPDLILGRGRERVRIAGGVLEWHGGVFEGAARLPLGEIAAVTASGNAVVVVPAAGAAWQVGREIDLTGEAREWVARRLRNVIWPKLSSL